MARIDDLGDKLRLGMNKLQAAVGETARGGPGGGGVSILFVYFQLFVNFFYTIRAVHLAGGGGGSAAGGDGGRQGEILQDGGRAQRPDRRAQERRQGGPQ